MSDSGKFEETVKRLLKTPPKPKEKKGDGERAEPGSSSDQKKDKS